MSIGFRTFATKFVCNVLSRLKTFAGGTRLALITCEEDEEVERPLVPAKGSDFHGYLATLATSLLPKKQILHRISGLLRGHCSDGLKEKFDDNLYVHISDLMHELHDLFPSQIPMPWSMRVWVPVCGSFFLQWRSPKPLKNDETWRIILRPINIWVLTPQKWRNLGLKTLDFVLLVIFYGFDPMANHHFSPPFGIHSLKLT